MQHDDVPELVGVCIGSSVRTSTLPQSRTKVGFSTVSIRSTFGQRISYWLRPGTTSTCTLGLGGGGELPPSPTSWKIERCTPKTFDIPTAGAKPADRTLVPAGHEGLLRARLARQPVRRYPKKDRAGAASRIGRAAGGYCPGRAGTAHAANLHGPGWEFCRLCGGASPTGWLTCGYLKTEMDCC